MHLHDELLAMIFGSLNYLRATIQMYEIRAKSKQEAEILMYGSISEWGRVRAEDFISKLSDAKAKGYDQVKLKINSPGGSIIEGIAIASQMITNDIIIVGVVEGMAASMASAMLQACHKRVMVKGTRLMIHQGSGGIFGSANFIRDYADLMDSFNKTLAEIYARRTKKEAKWILDNWMAEGKDKWFTPEEALAANLIDEVIEGNVKPLEKETATLMEMAAHYKQFTDTNENLMNKEQLIKLFGLKADASDAEVQAAVEAAALLAKAKATEATPPAAGSKPEVTAAADKAALVEGVVAMAKERGADDTQQAAIKKIAEIDIKAAIDLLPKKSEAAAAPSVTELIASLKGGGSSDISADKKNWTLTDWMKKDEKGLFAMAKDKPAEYIKLFNAEYGFEPSLEEIKKLVG